MMLAKESIWSRGLYTPASIAYADLMAHLGRELTRMYDGTTEETLPEQWSHLLKQLGDAE